MSASLKFLFWRNADPLSGAIHCRQAWFDELLSAPTFLQGDCRVMLWPEFSEKDEVYDPEAGTET